MAAITVRNLSDEVHRALKQRAEKNGRSTEAEIRDILEASVHPGDRVKIGSELAAFGRRYGGVDIDVKGEIEPARAADFD